MEPSLLLIFFQKQPYISIVVKIMVWILRSHEASASPTSMAFPFAEEGRKICTDLLQTLNLPSVLFFRSTDQKHVSEGKAGCSKSREVRKLPFSSMTQLALLRIHPIVFITKP